MNSSGFFQASGASRTALPVGHPRSFIYTFPLLPHPVVGTAYPVYGLDLTGNGAASVVLHTREKLDRKAAFKKLSVALALLGIYEAIGLKERAPGGIGGFFASPSEEDCEEPRYREEVGATISQLEKANDPFQIQGCFTLSRGLAFVADPESAIIEYFKLIELYIKQLAWAGDLDAAAAKNVLEDKIIFSKRVREDLKARRVLAEQTVDLIYRMKEVRNKFVGHGGMRPSLGELFGDPEDNRQLLDQGEFKYDPHLQYGPGFFERVLNDVMLVGGFLFSKMQGLEPLVFARPGARSQGSDHVHDVLTAEGVRWIGPDPRRFKPV